MSKETGFVSNEELNKRDHHLRDLEITVDGLNVVDINLGARGAWAPRLTVQLSGDQGIDRETGTRRVYLAAHEYLKTLLLPDGADERRGRFHAFVPHANIRSNEGQAIYDAAITVVYDALKGLMAAFEGRLHVDGDGPAPDHFEWYGKSLHIVVRTVDFDLREKRILSAESFEHLQKLIDAPAEPSPELEALMGGERKYQER